MVIFAVRDADKCLTSQSILKPPFPLFPTMRSYIPGNCFAPEYVLIAVRGPDNGSPYYFTLYILGGIGYEKVCLSGLRVRPQW